MVAVAGHTEKRPGKALLVRRAFPAGLGAYMYYSSGGEGTLRPLGALRRAPREKWVGQGCPWSQQLGDADCEIPGHRRAWSHPPSAALQEDECREVQYPMRPDEVMDALAGELVWKVAMKDIPTLDVGADVPVSASRWLA